MGVISAHLAIPQRTSVEPRVDEDAEVLTGLDAPPGGGSAAKEALLIGARQGLQRVTHDVLVIAKEARDRQTV